MGKGGSFRTVKAKFPPATIQASAKRAGVYIRIDEEGPWLKVTVLGNVPPQPEVEKKPHTYQGAGKVYPREKPVIQSSTTRRKAPKLDISLHGGGFKNWRQFQKQPEIDIFS
ncbi:MAG TPA: hypothetical protein VMQ76_05285 [Terracidiphilus sp.]|nr:hypothetical protein [Terracidiphilus sp.]